MFARNLVLGASAAAALVASIGVSQAQAGDPGTTLFKQRCAVCHSDVKGARGPVGPNLFGVSGRKAGSTAFNYSPALKNSNLVWNKASLDRFLTNPGQMVPGTRMIIAIPDSTQRTAIISYLERRK